jgi:uncharacterized protein (TIGR03067 family)
MIHRSLLVSIGFGLLAAGAARGDDAKDAAKKLEGTWTVDSASRDGKDTTAKGSQIVFAGNKMTLKPAKAVESKEDAMTFQVDPAKKPGSIDFGYVGKAPPNTAPGKGIYELDGDTLKLCIGPPDKRPTEFTDKGALFMVLKRKK